MKKLHGCLKRSCDHEWALRCEPNLFGRPCLYWYCKKCGEIKACSWKVDWEEVGGTGWKPNVSYSFPCDEEKEK